jgi:hypothetical protein
MWQTIINRVQQLEEIDKTSMGPMIGLKKTR